LTTIAGRKTEEGWSIYKEDELGITNDGGGALRVVLFSLSHFLKTLPFVRLIAIAVGPRSVGVFLMLIHVQVSDALKT
jgi:hypothetical protein